MDQDATWYGGKLGPKRHCVTWGPSFPSPKKGQSPQFLAHVYCGQTVAWIKMPLGREVEVGPGDVVLDGDPAPPKGHSPLPQFSADVCCGQTAGWIKMPLCMVVGLGPGDIVLDGDPAPVKKRHSTALFWLCLLWPNSRPSQLLLSSCFKSGQNRILRDIRCDILLESEPEPDTVIPMTML